MYVRGGRVVVCTLSVLVCWRLHVLFYELYKQLLAMLCFGFFFQAEDGIRDLVRSRGLGDVYKRQCRKSLYAGGYPGIFGDV